MPISDSGVFSPETFALPLLEWHLHHGRSLPWMTKQPYDVWLSEVMLQQTQVSTVLDRFASFKVRFPSIRDLASAPVEDVLAQWSGLGYYRRARNLHACAQALVHWLDTHGDWPKEAKDWVALPGIGLSTANAIVSACFDKVAPILDANAKRVLLRFAGEPDANDKQAWTYAHEAMDVQREQAARYTQAMMDLGATVCTARKAHCQNCPLVQSCKSAEWEIKAMPKVIGVVAKKKEEKPILSFDWAYCLKGVGTQAQMLLQQRDESSFWPQLWVLPTMDTRFAVKDSEERQAKSIKHELSHRSLRIQVQPCTLKGAPQSNERWVPLSDITERKISVPSPVATLVNDVLKRG